jgi:hypothetical protein
VTAATAKVIHRGQTKLVDAATPDLKLSSEPGLGARADDLERLVAALDIAARDVEARIALAMESTEVRCKAELQQAVDGASTATARSTERRMQREREEAVEKAIAETQARAEREKRAAVAEAIRETESRCAEEQRIAVQKAISSLNLQYGKTQEDIAAENASKSFAEAVNVGDDALAFAKSLQAREREPASKKKSPPAPRQPPAATHETSKSSSGLEFF